MIDADTLVTPAQRIKALEAGLAILQERPLELLVTSDDISYRTSGQSVRSPLPGSDYVVSQPGPLR